MFTSCDEDDDASVERLYKLMIVGDIGTGKSAFFKRFIHNIFTPTYTSTTGVDFGLKAIRWDKSTVVRLQLWDVGGAERFGNMTSVYYKECVGAILIYDMTRPNTLEGLLRWKADLDQKGPPVPAILVATKCDLPGAIRKPREEMQDLCARCGFEGWFEVSAKTNAGIERAMHFLTTKIIQYEQQQQPPPPPQSDSTSSNNNNHDNHDNHDDNDNHDNSTDSFLNFQVPPKNGGVNSSPPHSSVSYPSSASTARQQQQLLLALPSPPLLLLLKPSLRSRRRRYTRADGCFCLLFMLFLLIVGLAITGVIVYNEYTKRQATSPTSSSSSSNSNSNSNSSNNINDYDYDNNGSNNQQQQQQQQQLLLQLQLQLQQLQLPT